MNPFQKKRPVFGAALLATSFLAAAAAHAQAVNYPVGAVVQSLQQDAGSALARHLRDLNSSPKNLTSLLGAGNAALEVGDPRSALTFFARAEEVAPRDGRVKAGMGSAFVQTEQARAALKFFAEAASMGAPVSTFAKDRGLAYDMIGDNRRAQADYAVAMQRGRDPEVERRLALSKAITGDREGALAVLAPQIARGDRAGYRARAFVLALTGDFNGAAQAVQSVMPAQAGAMRPFLARLPELGPADRAMAVHFGHFPRAQTFAYSGAQYSLGNSGTPTYVSRPTVTAPTQSQPAQSQPTGAAAQPTARASRRASRRAAASGQPVQIKAQQLPSQPIQAPPVQSPPQIVQARPVEPEPQVAQRQPLQPQYQPQYQPPYQASVTSREVPSEPPTDLPASLADTVQLAQLPPSSVAAEQARPEPRSTPPPAETAPRTSQPAEDVDFEDVVSAVQSLPGAVERAPREKPTQLAEAAKPRPAAAKPADQKKAAEQKKAADQKKAEEKKAAPTKPQEPSRVWVQLAAAQDKSAFPGEFKRLKTKAAKVLGNKSAWTAPLGKTNRLLVGPFKTEEEARELVNQLSKVDISSYSWVSEAGQKIDKLPAK